MSISLRIIQVKTKLEGPRALWNTIAYIACYVTTLSVTEFIYSRL